MPTSCTATSTRSDSTRRERTSSSRGRAATDDIASVPFITKLIMTCCSCTRSPTTGEIFGQLCPQRYAVSSRFRPSQRDDLPNRVVDVERYGFCLGFLYQRSGPLDDVSRSIRIAHDEADGFPRLIEVRSGPGKPGLAGVAVGHDGGERLVDFVSDGCRQFSHRHDARNMSQFRLRLPQGVFGLLVLGHVHHRSDELDAARVTSDDMSRDLRSEERRVGKECRSWRMNYV